jgi:glycosyltransferase involved in cell wall biosynthesis
VNVAQLRSLSDLQAQYQLPSRYVHLPNQFWAHKNHGVVVDALAALKLQGTEITVACTGQTVDVRRPDHFGKLMERARDAGVSQNFRVLGLVPYSDMQALMLRACCVLNPSRFEGWSTTVEEAKVLGKRILLSDIPVHREQAPADGQYFSPDDALTLASLMKDAVAADASPIDAEEVDRRHKNALRVFGHTYVEIARQVCAA